jgi:hypothetical protein
MDQQQESKPKENTNTQPAPLTQQIVATNTQQPVAQSSAQEKPVEENQQEKNWKLFREQREKERKEAEEMAKKAQRSAEEAAALKAALDSVLNKQQPQANQYAEDETEEQKIDRRVNEIIAQREAAQERKRQEVEQQEFPKKLVSTFGDFNQVCTTENLDYFEYHYPEVAMAFKNAPDSFDKWAGIYKAVKRFVPNVDSKKEQVRAENNFKKPQSLSSQQSTQTEKGASPTRLDEARKAANWERMQKALKQLN